MGRRPHYIHVGISQARQHARLFSRCGPLIVGALLVVGCAEEEGEVDADGGSDGVGSGETGGSDGADTGRPTPHGETPPDGQAPSLNPEDATRIATAAMAELTAVNAEGVVQMVEQFTTEFTEGCPEASLPEEVEGTYVGWIAEQPCTTPGGLTVSGSGNINRMMEGDAVESRSTVILTGAATRLEHADGRWIEFTGTITISDTRGPQNITNYGIGGDFMGDATTAQTVPLLRPDVRVTGEYFLIEGEQLSITGGLSTPNLAPVRSVEFNGVIVQPTMCGSEPAGTISMRDVNSYWHQLVFSVPPKPDTPEAEDPFATVECDGCGTLSVEGQSSGPVCLGAGVLDPLIAG